MISNVLDKYVGPATSDQSVYTFATLPTGLHNVSGDVFALEMTKKVATIVGLAVTDGLSRFRFGTRELRVIHAAIRPLPAVPLIKKAGPV